MKRIIDGVPNRAPERERRPREGMDDGADCVACGRRPTAISAKPLHTQLTPSSAARARREHRQPDRVDNRSEPSCRPLTH
jgi:hypothetical protein